MRLLKTIPKPPTELNSTQDNADCYHIKVITALVGGGARSKQLDPVSVVRPQSVRGHLRFWWRLTAGASFLSVKDMRRAEAKIFGDTKQQSALKIRITTEQSKPENSKFNLIGAVPDYAAFPFRQGDTKIQNGIEFKLHLNFGKLDGEQKEQVKTALQCWVNFGGIGARTRRGFGALECDKYNKLTFNQDSLNKMVKAHFCACAHKLLPKDNNANAAWQYAIKHLQMFRQGTGVGRSQGTNRSKPSISNWPEATVIRQLIEKENNENSATQSLHPVDSRFKDVVTASIKDNRGLFPRAIFGMPIRFEMMSDKLAGKTKPIQPTLVPQINEKTLDRFASPLILRPIKIGNQYHALALVLKHGQLPTKVLLKKSDYDLKDDKELTWDYKSQTTPKSDQSPAGNYSNALYAFLDYFDKSTNKNHSSNSNNHQKNNNSPKNDETVAPPTPQTVRGQVNSNRGNGSLILQYLNVKRVVSPAEAEKLKVLGNPSRVQLTLNGKEVINIEPIKQENATP